jgi:hypothetical protein
MNYLFFYLGELPDYFYESIKIVKYIDPDASIYICSDKQNTIENTYALDMNTSKNLIEKKETLVKKFENTPFEKNSLWYTSILRVYGLKALQDSFNLKSFVHFDSDVIIYKSFIELNELYCFNEQKINITKNDKNDLVFGYSYFPNNRLIEKLCKNIDSVLENYDELKKVYARGGEISEMRMLGIVDKSDETLFNYLPTLPYDNDEIVFDPAGYGQFLNGPHKNRGNYIFKRRWVSTNHFVGGELKSKRIKLFRKNGEPFVKYDHKQIPLANLHVHSKNLKKFYPQGFKN